MDKHELLTLVTAVNLLMDKVCPDTEREEGEGHQDYLHRRLSDPVMQLKISLYRIQTKLDFEVNPR